jgi:hypothetical protein
MTRYIISLQNKVLLFMQKYQDIMILIRIDTYINAIIMALYIITSIERHVIMMR